MSRLLTFPGSVKRDQNIETWMLRCEGSLGAIARQWVELIRSCGDDVRELLHGGHPTACIDDTAFAYVNAFKAHVNVGFFRGAELPDPDGLLEGNGKFMRHVKFRPDQPIHDAALRAFVQDRVMPDESGLWRRHCRRLGAIGNIRPCLPVA